MAFTTDNNKNQRGGGSREGGNRDRRRGRGGQTREPREKDEFDQVILDLARVTRVMAGGKRMRFRACVVIGDRKGRVGVGLAKGADVSLAISKATNDAKKHLITVTMTEAGSIPHEVRIRAHSSQLLLKPAPLGTGIIAGSVLRQVLELAGLRDVVGRIMGTGNKVSNARTAISALLRLRTPKFAAKKAPKVVEKTREAVDEQKEEPKKSAKKPAEKKKAAPKADA